MDTLFNIKKDSNIKSSFKMPKKTKKNNDSD